MAQPSFIIDQAICHFFDYWHYGLQPSLNVKTLPDGHLVVSISVTGDPASSLSRTSPKNQTIRRHRSGNGARKRRQLQRSKAPVLSNLKKDDDDDTIPENVNKIATIQLTLSQILPMMKLKILLLLKIVNRQF